MKNIKLIQMLKSFSKEEFIEFEKFIASPFHNHGRNYKSFVKALKKFYPAFDNENLTYEYIFRKAYPEKTFDKTFLSNAISRVFKMSEEFLQYKVFQKNERERVTMYLDELLERRLGKIFENNMEYAENNLFDYSNINRYYFFHLSHLEAMKYSHLAINDKQHHCHKKKFWIIENLFVYFLAELSMSYNAEMINKLAFNTQPDDFISDKIFSNINFDSIFKSISNFPEGSKIMMIYYHIIMSLKDSKNLNHFNNLKNSIRKNIYKFSREESFNLYQCLLNCSAVLAQSVNIKYWAEYLQILEETFDNGLYTNTEDGYLQINIYRNCIYISCRFEFYEWLERFIEKYTVLLNPDHRENMKNYGLGILEFSKNNFRECINYLSLFKSVHSYFALDSRDYILMSYYELGNYDTSQYYVDSYKHFITKDNKLSTDNKENCMRFVSCYSSLITLKKTPDKYQIELLKTKVTKILFLRNKEWLLRKMEEIKI